MDDSHDIIDVSLISDDQIDLLSPVPLDESMNAKTPKKSGNFKQEAQTKKVLVDAFDLASQEGVVDDEFDLTK